MYRVLLVFNNYELMQQLEQLHVWGVGTEFEISKRLRDGQNAYREMKKRHYDLAIIEINLSGMDGLQLLRIVKREKLCQHIVLCSEIPSFDYARQGIILGAYDYLVFPFEESTLYSIMNRIKSENYVSLTMEINYSDTVLELFSEHDKRIYDIFPEIVDKIYTQSDEMITADKMIRNMYKQIMEGMYRENKWLSLYKEYQELSELSGIHEGNLESYKNFYSRKVIEMFDIYNKMFPKISNEDIKNIVIYILNNPESGVKEKDIAEKLFINTSLFSTVFLANTGQRFVDYVLNVKLQRAAYLLRNSKLKISEISLKLGYKDTGYFSKLFKRKFEVTPSDYRMLDSLEEFGGYL